MPKRAKQPRDARPAGCPTARASTHAAHQRSLAAAACRAATVIHACCHHTTRSLGSGERTNNEHVNQFRAKDESIERIINSYE